MAVLAWTMMGIAIWHFTVFVPDKFLWGIVGAFLSATAGAIVVALALHGFSVPSRDDTDILTALLGAPGAVIGMGIFYALGARQEGQAATA